MKQRATRAAGPMVMGAAAAAVAAITVAVAASPVAALEVSRTGAVAAAPARVWVAIGDFCGIGAWHPAIESCTLSDGGGRTVRTLALKGGGRIVEEQLARDDRAMGYTYTILEGPLPVSNYRSTIAVVPADGGSTVTWTGTFDAKGVPDEEAAKVIGGIYDAGIDGLTKAAR